MDSIWFGQSWGLIFGTFAMVRRISTSRDTKSRLLCVVSLGTIFVMWTCKSIDSCSCILGKGCSLKIGLKHRILVFGLSTQPRSLSRKLNNLPLFGYTQTVMYLILSISFGLWFIICLHKVVPIAFTPLLSLKFADIYMDVLLISVS